MWGISESPTLESNDGFSEDGSGMGEFTSFLTDLSSETFYHVRAYATNHVGTTYGNQVVFTTPAPLPDLYSLSLTANPEEAGEVSGEGEYEAGEWVTVIATSNENYDFVNWRNENEEIVSSETEYAFTMPAHNLILTAWFDLIIATESISETEIRVFPNPTSNLINIESPRSMSRIIMTDMAGREVHSVRISGHTYIIDVEGFEPGLFVIRIETEAGIFLKKVAVQK